MKPLAQAGKNPAAATGSWATARRHNGFTLIEVVMVMAIFSIGILVDDAIVVIENIARHWGMKDGRDRLRAAILSLPPEQRDALLLKLESGLKMEDIARVTGVRRETVKSRLRYAVARLRKRLEEPAELPTGTRL